MKKPVRVLVVDDSALMRKLIPKILEADDEIEVVGTAMDGYFGLKKIGELSPQVVTLDLEMPGMNGIDTLKEIMRRYRLPVIVVSSHSTAGASITLKALALGAFDFVAKPQDVSARMPEIAAELIKKIHGRGAERGGAGAVPAGRSPGREDRASCGRWRRRTSLPSAFPRAVRMPCNTCSRSLPAEFSGSILVVQHMPDGFTELFAQAAGRELPHPGKRSAIGRLAGGRAGADLSGKPAHEGEEIAAGQRGGAGG